MLLSGGIYIHLPYSRKFLREKTLTDLSVGREHFVEKIFTELHNGCGIPKIS